MFSHLRLHTEFSVVDGTTRIDDIVKAAAKDGQPALAITDLNNLFGAVKFYKEARGKGVKPLIGVEIILEGLGQDPLATSRMLLLVQNKQGYLNLSEILARAWTSNVHKAQALVKLAWLKELARRSDCAFGGAQRCHRPGPGAGRYGPCARSCPAALDHVSASLLPRAAARRSS
jgi:DNA polymerase III subunit alpha